MNFDEYQSKASETAVYPSVGSNPNYPIIGLVNEAGELAGAWKKYLRGDISFIEVKERIMSESGDVLWYLSQIITEFNLSLDDIALHNLDKLEDRKRNNTLRGDGEHR